MLAKDLTAFNTVARAYEKREGMCNILAMLAAKIENLHRRQRHRAKENGCCKTTERPSKEKLQEKKTRLREENNRSIKNSWFETKGDSRSARPISEYTLKNVPAPLGSGRRTVLHHLQLLSSAGPQAKRNATKNSLYRHHTQRCRSQDITELQAGVGTGAQGMRQRISSEGGEMRSIRETWSSKLTKHGRRTGGGSGEKKEKKLKQLSHHPRILD